MNYIYNKSQSNNKTIISNNIFINLKIKIEKNKQLIDNYEKEWHIIKKMIHDYEYIYKTFNIYTYANTYKYLEIK